MLGSVHDAEDAMQEALLRAWRAIARFEGRSSLRTWLYTIATNVCLKAIERRPKLVLPVDFGPPTDPHELTAPPLAESVWIEPYPDEALGLEDGLAAPEARYEQREGVELAFVAALQHLPPNQRAALILREVLGFSAREVAETLDTTVDAANSALARARRSLEQRLPDRSQQTTLRALGDDAVREVVERYVDALDRGDVQALVAMLTEDASWSMPPYELWLQTHDDIVTWCLGPGYACEGSKLVPISANGSPAFAQYKPDPAGGYSAWSLQVLDVSGDQITGIMFFLDVEAFYPLFDLPLRLEA
jgi:RNA polymerase sigma-70 factor (ECF subfamily)